MRAQRKVALSPAKAEEAFRTISEVAEELAVPKHVLRFWELKFPQVRPMKRGGGRRYYRPEDTRLLRGIRELLYRDGYTIKGVQKILREQGLEAVKVVGETPSAQEPAPTQGRTGRKRVAGSAEEAAGARRSPQPVASDNALRMLRQAIAELELCRSILKGDAAPGAVDVGAAANDEGSAAA